MTMASHQPGGMFCPLCGFGPIRVGLVACQGCGATIAYFSNADVPVWFKIWRVVFLIGILGLIVASLASCTAALFNHHRAAANFSNGLMLFGAALLIGLVTNFMRRRLRKKITLQNLANGMAWFSRPATRHW